MGNKNLATSSVATMRAGTVPPRSKRFANAKIFAERFVVMRGQDYYMRVYTDDSSEFVRFDEKAGKWVHLIFLTA